MVATTTDKPVLSGTANRGHRPYPATADTTNEGNEGNDNDDTEEEEDSPPMGLEVRGVFSELVVWEHGRVAGADDAVVRAMDEWVGMAAAVSIDWLLAIRWGW